MAKPDPTTRFSDRVDRYIDFRPGYPRELIAFLAQQYGLGGGSLVADVGAGTGKLSALFLEAGCEVVAVEPNDAMRGGAESELGHYPSFRTCPGRAEATGLAPDSCDFVTVAQAFHWFDRKRAGGEFLRILKKNGRVVLVWNDSGVSPTEFQSECNDLMRQISPEYGSRVGNTYSEEALREFFLEGSLRTARFPNPLEYTLEELIGRMLSSSFAPLEGPGHEKLVDGLRAGFARHAQGGKVPFGCVTHLFCGIPG